MSYTRRDIDGALLVNFRLILTWGGGLVGRGPGASCPPPLPLVGRPVYSGSFFYPSYKASKLDNYGLWCFVHSVICILEQIRLVENRLQHFNYLTACKMLLQKSDKAQTCATLEFYLIGRPTNSLSNILTGQRIMHYSY